MIIVKLTFKFSTSPGEGNGPSQIQSGGNGFDQLPIQVLMPNPIAKITLFFRLRWTLECVGLAEVEAWRKEQKAWPAVHTALGTKVLVTASLVKSLWQTW